MSENNKAVGSTHEPRKEEITLLEITQEQAWRLQQLELERQKLRSRNEVLEKENAELARRVELAEQRELAAHALTRACKELLRWISAELRTNKTKRNAQVVAAVRRRLDEQAEYLGE
jgi:hypothetical protein